MKVTQRQLKHIIQEELDKELLELADRAAASVRPPDARDGYAAANGYKDSAVDGARDRREKGPGRTRGEQAAVAALENTQAWAKQLTPVKYRQFLEDVKRFATEAERQSQKSGQRGRIKCADNMSLNGAKNAMAIAQSYALRAMKGKVTAQRAANFEKTFENCEVLLAAVLDSGYPGVHTA